MMTNLFAIFDPSTSQMLSMNWISMIIPILLIPLKYWNKESRKMMMFKSISNLIHKEFKMLLGMTFSQGTTILIMSMLWFIMMNNLMGLLPFIFTATSHMSLTLAMALPLWMTFMIFGWKNNTKKMFAHLLPNGTPPALMMFMILIETISNIIRPITLSIRLAANMIAGHLLLTLLGNQGTILNNLQNSIIINTQFLLLVLELAVAMIQAYVFIILISLYSTEIH